MNRFLTTVCCVTLLCGCGTKRPDLPELDSSLKQGMTEEQVLHVAGKPDRELIHDNRKVWTYISRDRPSEMITITFENGIILRKSPILGRM